VLIATSGVAVRFRTISRANQRVIAAVTPPVAVDLNLIMTFVAARTSRAPPVPPPLGSSGTRGGRQDRRPRNQ